MRIGQVLGTLVNGVLILCAVVVTGLVIRHEFFTPAPAGPSRPTNVSNWRAYARGGHRSGPEHAPVTMVVFSDFQCPACRVLATHVKALRTEFPRQLAVIHRHSPLSMHPFAVDAARASECAAEQGRFEAFHDALFLDQSDIGLAAWDRFADSAEVPDLDAFNQCMSSGAASRTLQADTLAGKSLKVLGTPTLLINGVRYNGTPPLDTLRAIVARAATPSAK